MATTTMTSIKVSTGSVLKQHQLPMFLQDEVPRLYSRRNRAQRLVSYLVRTTPPGNVRVSTRFRFTQLSLSLIHI